MYRPVFPSLPQKYVSEPLPFFNTEIQPTPGNKPRNFFTTAPRRLLCTLSLLAQASEALFYQIVWGIFLGFTSLGVLPKGALTPDLVGSYPLPIFPAGGLGLQAQVQTSGDIFYKAASHNTSIFSIRRVFVFPPQHFSAL